MDSTPSSQEQKTFLKKTKDILTIISLAIGSLLGLAQLCRLFHIDRWLVQILQNKQLVLLWFNRLFVYGSFSGLFGYQILSSMAVCLWIIERVFLKNARTKDFIFRLALLFIFSLMCFHNIRHPLLR